MKPTVRRYASASRPAASIVARKSATCSAIVRRASFDSRSAVGSMMPRFRSATSVSNFAAICPGRVPVRCPAVDFLPFVRPRPSRQSSSCPIRPISGRQRRSMGPCGFVSCRRSIGEPFDDRSPVRIRFKLVRPGLSSAFDDFCTRGNRIASGPSVNTRHFLVLPCSYLRGRSCVGS